MKDLKMTYSAPAIRKLIIVVCLLLASGIPVFSQVIDGSYVKALYKKYPTIKSDLCTSCLLWVNPYFQSIADTATHRPLVTHYVYTAAHRTIQEGLNIDRKGVYATWHSVAGQKNEDNVYTEANSEIGDSHSPSSINKGHCQAWILLAWNVDAAILSNTYTFNSAMEYAGQNTGTEEASEDTCRTLTGWKGANSLVSCHIDFVVYIL
jgi:hypothetical protein